MQPALLHVDYFDPSGIGQGIGHRSAQVHELLGLVGLPVVKVLVNPATVSKAVGLAWGVRYLRVPGLRSPRHIHNLGRYGRRLAAYVRFFRRYPPGSCVVWCLTGEWVIPHAARICGFPVVTAVMTLESVLDFDYGIYRGRSRWSAIKLEIEQIAQADAVTCISREEQWLLAAFGVDPDILPAYPDANLTRQLLEIRATRAGTTRGAVLILSSHTNPPNRAGVLRLAELLGQISPSQRPPVLLAGLDSERFREQISPEIMTILGTVDSPTLDRLMVEARCLLLHQRFGTGALTRIPEALVAGIPVVCNGIAGRSAHHYSGVHTFETAAELAELLSTDLPDPPVPPPPKAAEDRFVATIRRVAGLAPVSAPVVPSQVSRAE